MEFPRIIISSDRSDSGKTLFSSALMRLLSKKLKVRGFKAGPDFIDPKYHKIASGVPSINLDLWMMGEQGVIRSLSKYGKGYDLGIIEGVMGLYDGIDIEYSTYKLSLVTKTPIILLINCSNVSSTVGAIIKGLKEYGNANVKGVVFNQIRSESHYNYCRNSVKDVPVLGYVKFDEKFVIPSRHLGLYTTEDYKEAEETIKRAAESIEKTVDIGKILEIAHTASLLPDEDLERGKNENERNKIAAIAYDSAFNFYYEENIDLLRKKYEIRLFSPLMNETVENADLIYIGGGYPELHLPDLEKSHKTIGWIRKEAENGKSILAECGGLMYLSKEIIDERSYKMANLFDISIKAKDKLTIGYTELEIIKDNLLGSKGQIIRGHEFHVSRVIDVGKDIEFSMQNKLGKGIWDRKDGVTVYNVLASYSHFHFSSTTRLLSFNF